MNSDSVFYNLPLLVLLVAALVVTAGASELGNWVGRRSHAGNVKAASAGTLAGASLGLLALLIAFSFSIALARFDARRTAVLDEANAINSTANFALMLPQRSQRPILKLLREYATVRIGLGVPYGPMKLQRDIAKSLKLQNLLWQRAATIAAAAPQSLPIDRFVGSLNEMNNVQEQRVTTLRVRMPIEVFFMLIGISAVAMGFVGLHIGLDNEHKLTSRLLMTITIVALIILIVDLDRPSRGVIQVSTQPLVDAAQSIRP